MNLFDIEQPPSRGERFETLQRCRNVIVERIASSTEVDGEVYNQPQDEWVALLRGTAVLDLAGEPRALRAGDYVFIAAHQEHRVVECSGDALWLAIHIHPESKVAPCQIQTGSFAEVAGLEAQIPEFDPAYDENRIAARIGLRRHLSLVARVDGQPAGFKLGYETGPGRFSSWIGGVVPTYRRQGVAQQLLDAQEAWCRTAGYREVTVKSRNRFRGMVALLVRNGYDIEGVRQDGVLLLRKHLTGGG